MFSLRRIVSSMTSSPSPLAAACTSAMSAIAPGVATLAMIARRRRPGTTSRNRSRRLPATSGCCTDRPVTLPPGLGRLATRPVPTGSAAAANTMGMVDVARLAASTFAVPEVKIRSTLSRANSAAISAARSLRPSAQRYSMATVRPSVQPSSRRRCRKAAVHGPWAAAVFEPRNPMTGIRPGCCPRAASGHVMAAAPSNEMNARRLTRSPRRRGRAAWLARRCRALSRSAG